MAVNTSHTPFGVWLNYGESMLLHLNHINLQLSGNDNPLFKGTRKGRVFLTSHRIIFKTKKTKYALQSFSVPLLTLFNLSIGQPIFRSNFVSGSVFALPNGNFEGSVHFKIIFKHGGALLFADFMLRAIKRLLHNIESYSLTIERENRPPEYVSPDIEDPPPSYEDSLKLCAANQSEV